MPKPFICKKCGFDMELAPRHECKGLDLINDSYECVVINSETNEIVRSVKCEDMSNALKLEILFNVGNTPEKYIAEARFNGVKI